MFKINRKVEYALIALRHIKSAGGKLVSAKEICDVYKTPFDTTSRVLQIMAQQGVLKAEHGAYGGYELIKNLSQLSFLELVEMIVGPIKIANCFSGDYSYCEVTASCNVIAPMLNLNERMSRLFQTINVAELLESRHQHDRIIKEKYIEKYQSATSNIKEGT